MANRDLSKLPMRVRHGGVGMNGAAKCNTDARQRRRENSKRLLRPRHIAFIGARAVEESINLYRRGGFEGDPFMDAFEA